MPVSYSTPQTAQVAKRPTRTRRQLRGWVGGKLCCGVAFRSWSKSGPKHSAFEPRVRTPMLAPPYRSCRCYYAIYRRNSVDTRVQLSMSISARSRWPKPNKVRVRIESQWPTEMIDTRTYRYVAYLAYEAYRPRPLPRTLRIRVRGRGLRLLRLRLNSMTYGCPSICPGQRSV